MRAAQEMKGGLMSQEMKKHMKSHFPPLFLPPSFPFCPKDTKKRSCNKGFLLWMVAKSKSQRKRKPWYNHKACYSIYVESKQKPGLNGERLCEVDFVHPQYYLLVRYGNEKGNIHPMIYSRLSTSKILGLCQEENYPQHLKRG